MSASVSDKTTPEALESRAILSVGQAASYLGVSRRFVELEIQRQHLAVIRLGRRCLRIRRSALEQYLNTRPATA
jgi:excisionase family DNA binding protein